MRQNALALLAGALFAVGLGVSGMTQPSRVIGFLDVAGDWDPSLAFVMAGAISVHFLAYRALRRQESAAARGGAARTPRFPLLADRLVVPTRTDLDARLFAGAALFGVGWGLAGYCPGPALVSLATGSHAVLAFVAAMAAGMAIEHLTTGTARASARASMAPSTAAGPSDASALGHVARSEREDDEEHDRRNAVRTT
ncbi:YeeE/YedE family protein [Sorangium sp. So ce269]